MSQHPVFCPVFRDKEDNELVILHQEFCGKDYDEGWKIAMGAALVEGVLLGVKYVRVQEIDVANIPHQKATFGPYSVALIAGPVFDAAVAAANSEPCKGCGTEHPTAHMTTVSGVPSDGYVCEACRDTAYDEHDAREWAARR